MSVSAGGPKNVCCSFCEIAKLSPASRPVSASVPSLANAWSGRPFSTPKSPFTAATAPLAAAIWLVRAHPGKTPRASVVSTVAGEAGSTFRERICTGPIASRVRVSVTPGTTVCTVDVYRVVP